MVRSRFQLHPILIRLATTHALSMIVVLATLLSVANIPWLDWQIQSVLGFSLLVLVGSLWMNIQLVSPLLRLEERLVALADSENGSASESDTTLPLLAHMHGSSPLDHGWNKLAALSERWQTLNELHATFQAQLSDRRRGTGPQLLDTLTEGVATVDGQGCITYANSALAAMCGQKDATAVLGQTLAHAFEITDPQSPLFDAQSPSSTGTIEWTVNSDRGERVFRGQSRPGRKSDGAAIAYVWTIRDVTQQKLADSMRDKFLATATHEFRTPLANIRAYAESLDMSDDLDAESRKRFYNVIQSESLRLSQLVDDLLDISRMQAGAMALDCKETDLGRLVEEITQKVEGEMREKHLDFRCELPPKYPKVAIDKSKLAAALVNLLGNAVKYTPEGGRVTFRVDVAQQKVNFSVSDTGIGISEEDLPKVFERFYRCNDDRVREITGSGLGLALTQEVTRLHGGEITVDSQLNQGSTFRISLPLDSTAA